ncbi:MAG: type IV toxin-antitoxin system AbiEi family antitoxin domain-containing protein [Actinomycetales bacterium]
MHPLAALDLSGGVARWADLARLGVSRGSLLALATAGSIARPARGVFCRPEMVATPVVRAVVASGQLTCGTGARAHGLETFHDDGEVHVRTIAAPRPDLRDRTVVRHPWGRGPGRLVALDAVLHDCTICLPLPEAVAVVDSALRAGRVDASDLSRITRAGPRSARSARVMSLADPAAQSVLESVARVQLRLDGQVDVASQVYVDQVGWVDLVVARWLVLELDGWAHHRETFREDRRRDAELTRLGFVVLRFTYGDLLRRRRWFSAVVAETLDRGHPPLWFHPARPA